MKNILMKSVVLILSAVLALLVFVSCSDDDEKQGSEPSDPILEAFVSGGQCYGFALKLS